MTTAWAYQVTGATYGLVPTVDVRATRKCGRVEDFTAYLFPAGWRLGTSRAPVSVQRAALRTAKQLWQ
jgi:hypothetical protein